MGSSNNIGVYIGRFCPLHFGHQRIIDSMLETFGEERSIVFIGSCNTPISYRILFSYEDRRRWIKKIYPNLKIMGLPDYPGNDTLWFHMLDDALDCAFPNMDHRVYLGGADEDVQFYYNAGRLVKIIDRESFPCSGSNIRELLLQEKNIDSFINPLIIDEVKDMFRKRLKELDHLRWVG